MVLLIWLYLVAARGGFWRATDRDDVTPVGGITPAAVYALGAREAGCFESAQSTTDLSFFARALERAIRAWLDLPKL